MIPEIPNELKEKLKAERLSNYQAGMYVLQMDIAAYEAVADADKLAAAKQQLETLITAYNAVLVV